MIYHLSYRIDKGPKQHIYATKKICESKRDKLKGDYGSRVKFSKLEIA